MAKINTVDDFRPFAESLVANLNAAFKKSPDHKKNEQMFANQKVPEFVAAIAVIQG